MGKRSNFKRVARDLYQTPYAGFSPLIPHLFRGARFAEPCAASGKLIGHIESAGLKCVEAYDIKPLKSSYTIKKCNVLDPAFKLRRKVDFIITNPPWDRKILHAMIELFSDIAPTWLLFDAPWLYTKQSRQFRDRLTDVIPVGRLKWFERSSMSGKDDCSWYFFTKPRRNRGAKFHRLED